MRPPKFRFDWRYFGKRLARETLVTARKNAVVSVVAIAVTLGLRGYSFTGERTPAQSTPVAPKAPASKIIDRELLLTGPKADLDRLRASFPAGSKTGAHLTPLFSAADRAYLVGVAQKRSNAALATSLTEDADALVYRAGVDASDAASQGAEFSRVWSEGRDRIRALIRSQRLKIRIEENEAIRTPAPLARKATARAAAGNAVRNAFAGIANAVLPRALFGAAANAIGIDDYTDRQWYLRDSSVTLRYDAFDILDQSEFIKGVPGMDVRLNARAFGGAAPSNEGLGTVVAVLDSGVDVDHPDFRDADGTSRIVTTESECKLFPEYADCVRTRGKAACDRTYFVPANDTDHNGSFLDCHGWSAVEKSGSPIVTDTISHGTHVSGIIAASKNGFGVDGIAPKAKILPVRVISEDPSGGDNEKTNLSGVSVVSQVIRGLTYALRNKPDVINLSLGWNGRSDQPMMHDLIKQAAAEGIFIVAAAGNDGTDALVYPCAFPEVICVGAHRNDGRRLDFSNFGNGVDLSAPGMSILNLSPPGIASDTFTEKAGYDYKDGTSMATPIVAGAIARMISDGVPRSEIRARLFLGATKPRAADAVSTLSGLLNIDASVNAKMAPFFVPMTKAVYLAVLRPGREDFAIGFEATNIGAPSGAPVEVTVALRDPDAFADKLRLRTPTARFAPLAPGGKISFDIEFDRLNDHLSSEIELLVTLKTAGRSQTILVPVLLSTFLTKAAPPARTLRAPLQNPDALLKGAVLFSITALDGDPARDYLAILPEAEDEKSLTFQILRETRDGSGGKSYVVGPSKRIIFDRIVSPRVLQRLDVDLDGKSDYFVSFVSEPVLEAREEVSSFVVGYWNERIEEVLPSFTFSGVKRPTSVFRLDAYQWLRANVAGKMRLVPAWLDLNATVARPEMSEAFDPVLNPNPELAKNARIYYHDPSAGPEGLRTIPQRTLRGKTPMRFFDPVKPGSITVLFGNAAEDEENAGFSMATLTEGKRQDLAFVPVTLDPPRDLRTDRTDFAFIPMSENSRAETVGFQKNLGTPAQTFSLVRKEGSATRLQELQFKPLFPQDFIFKGMGGYYDHDRMAAFAMGVYDIYYKDASFLDRDPRAVADAPPVRTSLRRYTFLPSAIFDRQFYTASVDDGGTPMPGLRVPDGFGAYPGSEIIVPERDPRTGASVRLVRPAEFRFLRAPSDEDCEEMSPIPATTKDPYTAVYFCGDQFLQIPYRY